MPAMKSEEEKKKKKRQLRRSELWLGGALVVAVVALILVGSVLGERLATRCENTDREAITNSSTSIPALGIPATQLSTKASLSTSISSSISKQPVTTTSSSSSSSTSTSILGRPSAILATSTAISTSNPGTINLVLPSTGVLASECNVNEQKSFQITSTSYNKGYQSTFNSSCNTEYGGNNIAWLTTINYQQCIDACNSVNALKSSCIGISWIAELSVVELQGGNCYLKNRTDPPVMYTDVALGVPQIGAVLLDSGEE